MAMTKEKWLAKAPIRVRQLRIDELKALLEESDYKAIKHAEGLISEADYSSIKAERESYRAEINLLEAEIAELSNQIEGAAE